MATIYDFTTLNNRGKEVNVVSRLNTTVWRHCELKIEN